MADGRWKKDDGKWKMEDGTQLQLIMTDCHIKEY